MKRIFFIFVLVLTVLISAFFYWRTDTIKLKQAEFSNLPAWKTSKLKASFDAFERSCEVFFKQPSSKQVGTKTFPLTVKDWLPSCLAAKKLQVKDNKHLRVFFEHWFQPTFFTKNSMIEGTFTGYYLPVLKGSKTQSAEYKYPIYEKPNNLISIDLGLFSDSLEKKNIVGRIKGKKLVPYHNRSSINRGALAKSAKPLLWVNDRVDRFFLEIQGSGYVDMVDGSRLMLGYAAQNGRKYSSIGRYLISQGAFDKAHASMQSIRQYLAAHPQKIDKVLNQNDSFIFFKILDKGSAIGSQGAALTPGYSLAVDRQYIPLGVPMWLTTHYQAPNRSLKTELNRLMIAQDTGGAIKGRVRGDVFWGGLKDADYIAGHMNDSGQYWIFLPKKLKKII